MTQATAAKKMKLTKKTKSDRIQQHFTKVGSSWNSIFFFGVTYIFAGHVKKKQTHTQYVSYTVSTKGFKYFSAVCDRA